MKDENDEGGRMTLLLCAENQVSSTFILHPWGGALVILPRSSFILHPWGGAPVILAVRRGVPTARFDRDKLHICISGVRDILKAEWDAQTRRPLSFEKGKPDRKAGTQSRWSKEPCAP